MRSEPVPLTGIVLPHRDEGAEDCLEELSGSSAVVELVRHSFVPNVVQALGWQSGRLSILSRLVEESRTVRLTYASDLSRLDALVDRIEKAFL